MESWELIVSPTDTYVYTGIKPEDPEAKYVEVVPKELLVRALLALEKYKKYIGDQPVKIQHHGSYAQLMEDPRVFLDLLAECDEVLDGFDTNKIYRGRPNYDDIPWADSSKWTPGHWYPLPIGSNWTESCLYVVEGYDLFYQDPENKDDIIPVGTPTMNFKEACDTCEFHNKEHLPGLR